MMGMGDVNQWSIRDETIHLQGNTAVFKQFLLEHPKIVNDSFKKEIYDCGRQVIVLEDAFIDLSFAMGAPDGITRDETKTYARSVCDYRMNQLGFKSEYNVKNPFEWLEWVTNPNGIENFFETNSTNYSKNSMIGSYSTGY